MTKVAAVDIHEFAYSVENIAPDHHRSPTYHRGRTHEVRKFAISVTTDDGIKGEYVPLWSGPPMALAQIRALAPAIIGHDIAARETLWDMASVRHRKLDRIGYSVIDIALWDALGKQASLPISAMLGRYRTRLKTYASTITGDSEPDGLSSAGQYADFAAECYDRGFAGFKFHSPSGAKLEDEIAILRAVSAKTGTDRALMVDPSNGLETLAQAVQLGRVCDEVGAFWIEDPMRGDSIIAHKRLRESIKTPLLLTEHVRSLTTKLDVLIGGGTDFLRADPEIDMGITGVMKTAHAAEALGFDVELHGGGPAQRQCMAAIRNTNFYEMIQLHPRLGNPLIPKVYADGYCETADAIEADGCVIVPDGPGLGVAYDWDYINAHAFNHSRFE